MFKKNLSHKTLYLLRTIILTLGINCAYAIASGEVSHDLNGLIGQINNVNRDINNKQKQEHSLSKAISDSGEAINKSQALLDHLKAQHAWDIKQLNQIESAMPELTQMTELAQVNMKLVVEKTYKQLRQLQTPNSVLMGNNSLLYERRKRYLVKLLELEQQKNIELQSKLDKLNQLNNKINAQLTRINSQLGITTKYKSKLEQDKEAKTMEAVNLQQKISQQRQKLTNLKAQQEQLNKLMKNLKAMEIADKEKVSKDSSKHINLVKRDDSYEDGSPFLSRKLSRPVEGGEAIVKFGQIRNTVPSNGILFKASSLPVRAISNGRVLYVGVLPG
ncbi:MAG: hypothetical protein K0R49_1704, partial [Burkholderiales bacterium]|nr:hypothetical protein [Burkholderiales bacterium]